VYVEGVDELDEQVDERVDFCETKVFLFWWLESPVDSTTVLRKVLFFYDANPSTMGNSKRTL
jgi:hypothetical protein